MNMFLKQTNNHKEHLLTADKKTNKQKNRNHKGAESFLPFLKIKKGIPTRTKSAT